MKKIVTFALLLCMVLTFAACTNTESTTSESAPTESVASESTSSEDTSSEDTSTEDTTPEMTLQEIYDAAKNLLALLGDHDSVYLVYTFNGECTKEEYYDENSLYTFYDGEYFEWEADVYSLVTKKAEYSYSEDVYTFHAWFTTEGLVNIEEEYFGLMGTGDFISTELLENGPEDTITQKDGTITVTCAFEPDEVETMDEGVVSCVETYTLDATTRELTSVKTVYTYEDGTVSEGIVTITRDVEMPQDMKKMAEYAQQTEDLRTVTVVFNPGAENEKTETIQVPKGVQIDLTSDYFVEESYTLYADAACTQPLPEALDTNSDLTVYVKWGE